MCVSVPHSVQLSVSLLLAILQNLCADEQNNGSVHTCIL